MDAGGGALSTAAIIKMLRSVPEGDLVKNMTVFLIIM
jgi:hypothetical protein